MTGPTNPWLRSVSRTLFVLCALPLLAASPVVAQDGGPAKDATAKEQPPEGGAPRDFELAEGNTLRLGNGMGVTLVPFGSLPRAFVGLVVRTGNIDENADQVWLSDLTGDLMAEGAGARDSEALAQAFAGLGGELRVGVGFDTASASTETLADLAPDAVRLVADVVRSPALPADELERLKKDRLRQIAIARQRPGALAGEVFSKMMFGEDHPYGRRFPTEEMLQGFTIDDIRTFHAENFSAARSHLFVVGSFDAEAVETAAREAFGDWPAGPAPTVDVPQKKTERKIYLVDRPGAEQSTLRVGLPVIDRSDERWVGLQVTNGLLGGAFSSRIMRNLREDKGYSYSPGSFVSSYYRTAVWAVAADVTTDVTGASLREIFAELERLRSEAVPADELEVIRNYLAGTFVLQSSSTFGIFGQLYQLDLHGLDRSWLETYVQKIHATTPDEIQRLAQDLLRDDEIVVVVVGDRAKVESQIEELGEVEVITP